MADEKILEEEVLDEEELEGVAGGTLKETLDDRIKLENMGVYKLGDSFVGSVNEAFTKLGNDIGVDLKLTSDANAGKNTANKYFIDGVQVSRKTMWNYIDDVYKKHKK